MFNVLEKIFPNHLCWKFLKSCIICKQKNSWPLLLKSLIKLSDIQCDIQIIWISRTFCMLFPMAGVNSRKKLCVCVCTCTYPYTVQGHLLLKNLSFTIFSIFVCIKALFPKLLTVARLPSHYTWYLKESIFQVLILEFPTLFSIHYSWGGWFS